MIRPMTAEDIAHVQQIVRATWRKMYEGILPEEDQIRFINRSYSDGMLIKRMEKTVALIAEFEGVPIGYANFTKSDGDGDAELTALYILPTHQRSGYGQKLVQAALSMLTDAAQLSIYVVGGNPTAHAFYEKQGFQLLGAFNETLEGHPVETAQYIYSFTNKKTLSL